MSRRNSIEGVLLGTAVADALGLPREGLNPKRALRLFGGNYLKYQFLGERGMFSDDTEHACMTGQALLQAQAEPEAFGRALGWQLRFWFVCFPVGVGWATLRSLIKLWIGFSYRSSGVWSGGNGPCMRAPLIGATFGHDKLLLSQLVRISTRITHVDPVAEQGAYVIALAAARAAEQGESLQRDALVEDILAHAPAPQLKQPLETVRDHLKAGRAASELATSLGLLGGVTGYSAHTVPVAIFCFLRNDGIFERAVADAISLGGDTDSVAAIVGGLCGAQRGAASVPQHLVRGLWEWPWTVRWMTELAARLDNLVAKKTSDFTPASSKALAPLHSAWVIRVLRNIVFFMVVLKIGFRRMFPPYLSVSTAITPQRLCWVDLVSHEQARRLLLRVVAPL